MFTFRKLSTAQRYVDTYYKDEEVEAMKVLTAHALTPLILATNKLACGTMQLRMDTGEDEGTENVMDYLKAFQDNDWANVKFSNRRDNFSGDFEFLKVEGCDLLLILEHAKISLEMSLSSYLQYTFEKAYILRDLAHKTMMREMEKRVEKKHCLVSKFLFSTSPLLFFL